MSSDDGTALREHSVTDRTLERFLPTVSVKVSGKVSGKSNIGKVSRQSGSELRCVFSTDCLA